MSLSTSGHQLVLRRNAQNPNHHLWNNNGTWWCHATVHLPDLTKRRLRISLRTSFLEKARLRRDTVFARGIGNECPTAKRRAVTNGFQDILRCQIQSRLRNGLTRHQVPHRL